ncbi:MAG: hypothetical protein NC388_10640 [Clostridium sp.]|nr:hypothetical protein [Clostridium sp.]
MMREENNIRNKMGKSNPFRVPEGYFEQLTDSVLNRLPEQATRPKTRFKTLRLIGSIAAAACGIFLCTTYSTGLFTDQSDKEAFYSLASDNDDDELLDELLDYSLTDNMEIAYYLTTAE